MYFFNSDFDLSAKPNLQERYKVIKGLMKGEIVQILPKETDDAEWVIVRFNEGGEIALRRKNLKLID